MKLEERVLEACLLIGRIMMMNSAEMYRVEDTMLRVGKKAGFNVVCYTTQTGLFVGIDGKTTLRMSQITNRTINLDKVTKANQLSREFWDEEIDLETLIAKLQNLEKERLFFPYWLELVSAATISGGMMILFGGKISDIPTTFIIGGIAYILYLNLLKTLQIRILSEFFACFLAGIMALIAIEHGLVEGMNTVIIGSVMPFVPGVAITNSLRDLLAGHLLSGISRLFDATLTACAIGFGIAFAFQLF